MLEVKNLHATIAGKEILKGKYSWNNNAVKQKNQFTAPYHYQAQKFTTFFDDFRKSDDIFSVIPILRKFKSFLTTLFKISNL